MVLAGRSSVLLARWLGALVALGWRILAERRLGQRQPSICSN
jgi:hypothetical protein